VVLDGSGSLGSRVRGDACPLAAWLVVRVLDRRDREAGGQVRLAGFARFYGKAGRQQIERRVGAHVGGIEASQYRSRPQTTPAC
jgi:hypothetical protein